MANISLLFKTTGESYDISCACTSSAQAIITAARLIKSGEYDMVIAGGSEELSWGQALGFNAMRALSKKYNDTPDKASRPFDKDRDGFVLADGAGMLVLESEEHALKRGAVPKAVVSGYYANSNAVDMVVPSAESTAEVMGNAIKSAGLTPEDVAYVNTHGTSTPVGDPIELNGIRMVFGGGNVIIRQKYHLHFVVDIRIGGDKTRPFVDILDDRLGTEIPRCGLGGKDIHGGGELLDTPVF